MIEVRLGIAELESAENVHGYVVDKLAAAGVPMKFSLIPGDVKLAHGYLVQINDPSTYEMIFQWTEEKPDVQDSDLRP